MLEITPDDIANLDDEDLRSLVGYLCESELRALGHSTSAATWGGNQNAADGGIDVRVTLSSEQPIGGFLPRPRIGFQVKKTDFTPAMIGPEMCPSGVIRPSILKLLQESGSYIIASSGSNTSDSALSDRVAAMREAVRGAADANNLHVDFYDRSRLATWTRSYPGLMLWVRRRIGRALSGWQSYESWAFSPQGVKDEYLLDDKARLHAGTRDERGISVTDGITRMREALRHPRGVVRLAGLSGVGKTRLVQALFDERVGTESLDPAHVVYTDMSDNPDPQPTGMIHDLIATRMRAIAVIDNCAPDLHRRLSELCRVPDSMMSVITVEYDIQDDEPEGTEVFRLEPSTLELVADLIARRFPAVSKVDAQTIANFSGGNARVALALANTIRNETLAGLKDEDLFQRLFHQRQTHDGSLLKAAQACALLYSFQGESLSGAAAELPVIAALIGISATELFAKVAELKQRDLVQRRGEWRAVLPHAIANRLAVMALKTIPLEVIDAHFTSERLARSFSRRLGYLHESEEAVGVVKKWLATDGMLNDVGALNELGIAMFNNIAPVSPFDTLKAIERGLNGSNAQGIAGESWRRDRIITTLRSLAYDADLFERSISAMLTVGGLEPMNGYTRPVEDSLKGLFHLYLSGTNASAEQRARVVDGLLRSADRQKQIFGLKLLDAMFESNHFSSTHAFEFGARPRDYGFWPKNREEHVGWYLTTLTMAEALAYSDLPIAEAVQSEIAGALRGLWFQDADVRDRLEAIARNLQSKGYWQQAWIAARTTLSFLGEKADPDAVTRLREFEKALRPKNLVERVRAIVLSGSWRGMDFADFDEDSEDSDENPVAGYERANTAAEELGKEVAKDPTLFAAILPDLVKGNADRFPFFGRGLALASDDQQATWDNLTKALASTPEDQRNTGVLRGFLWGLQIVNQELCESVLGAAVEDETLAAWFPVLQTSVPITKEGVKRLKQAVALGKAWIGQFQFLGWARASDVIEGSDLRDLLSAIAALPGGYSVAIDVLSMRLHSDRDKKIDHQPELIELGRELLSQAQFESRDNMQDHRMRMIIDASLRGPEAEMTAKILSERFKKGLADYSIYAFHFPKVVEGIFKHQPRVALDTFFGDALSDAGEMIEVDSFDDPSDRRKNPLDAIADEELMNWCLEGEQSRYAAIARAISFFRAGEDKPIEWTPLALQILRNAPDTVPIFEIFFDRFSPRSWSGSRAAIMESRLPLLDGLQTLGNSAIIALASRKRSEFQASIARQREWENERDRERDERFE